MATVITTAPAVEPISLAEVKTHLRIDTADEEGLLQALILTSRLHIEVALNLALITQNWSCYFDQWPATLTGRGVPHAPASAAFTSLDPHTALAASASALRLPHGPVKSVDAVRVYADDGTFVLIPVTGFALALFSRPARIARRIATSLPTPGRALNGIEFAITAGFGATPADVPSPIRQALLLLVAHWYEHRDPGEIGTAATQVPATVSALLAPWTPVRL
jgi:Phage gp6-like head-tail connector protein